MELKQLRYFVAIAEERSLTRAAERLWTAMPGLSVQMRRLEGELGVQLLRRHSRGVDLTAAGELFLERARSVLAAVEVAEDVGRDLAAGMVGCLRVGLAALTGSRVAAAGLAELARECPRVEITVFEAHGGALVRELRDGRLDAVIAPSAFAAPDLQGTRLAGEPWLVLVGRRHALAGDGPVAAAALGGHDVLITGHRDGAAYDRAVSELLESLDVRAALVPGGPGPAFLAAVAAGDAVAVTTASSLADQRGLMARPLEPVKRLRFDLLWRHEAPSPPLAALIRIAQARARLPERRMTVVAA